MKNADVKRHLTLLILRASEARNAIEAMQFAQAAANAANAVQAMSAVGMFRAPGKATVAALERLLEEARQSPEQLAKLPNGFDVRIEAAPPAPPTDTDHPRS